MKNVFLITGLFLCSCSNLLIKKYKHKEPLILSWKSDEVGYFDVYSSDTLFVTKIPCSGTKKMTIHNYPPGQYRFVFVSHGVEVESRKIKVVKK